MNWETIRNEFESTDITLKDLAEKHNVKLGTLKSRRSRENWSRASGVATKPKKVATPKKDATQDTQRNRSGNPNPSHKFPNHNSYRLKHGLYSKYLSETQRDILEDFKDVSLSDRLWLQIELKFSAIIQMQKVMWVEGADDHLKEESGNSWGDGSGSETYKISFAFERYESYIKAQTRAMAEFRNMVRQFDEMAHIDDERRLKLEGMRLGIEKTKAEIDKIAAGDDDKPIEILIKRKT
jgi:uncharacterized protein YjcR